MMSWTRGELDCGLVTHALRAEHYPSEVPSEVPSKSFRKDRVTP